MTRDELGRLVRETWVAYCLETGDTKPSHIAPYDELSEWDKEADRRIGEAVMSKIREKALKVSNDLYSHPMYQNMLDDVIGYDRDSMEFR